MKKTDWGKENPNRISKNNGATTKQVTCVMGILEGEDREKGREGIFKTKQNFPQINVRYQATDSRSSENIMKDQ